MIVLLALLVILLLAVGAGAHWHHWGGPIYRPWLELGGLNLGAVLLVVLLLLLIGCTPAQTQKTVVAGQLFCARASLDGPLVVAIADAAGAPVVVTGMAASAVAAVCAEIDAIPVTPPPAPGAAPVVAVALPASILDDGGTFGSPSP